MHILIALPGLHRVERGAEIAFEAIAEHLARTGRHKVTVLGSGHSFADRSYDFHHVPCVGRRRFEHWPKFPFLRTEFMYEDMTFAAGLLAAGSFGADVTVTCSYPYTNWALRRPILGRQRPAHVFVTQNGDWPAASPASEARFFGCEGLVCTNPIYFDRNQHRWPCVLIPNGLDPERFRPGRARRAALGLPTEGKLVLMVSALEPGKRVIEAMRAVALLDDTHLVVAGDGPQRDEIDRLSREILPGRFQRSTFPRDAMPELYRCADVFLHTKIEESFGNVYIEALSSGVPVVAHDDAVTRWIFDGRALLVDTRSSEKTAAAIDRALTLPGGDSDADVTWSHERFAWRQVAAQYEQFFETVLKEHRAQQSQGPR